jgi:hypothetical protein
MIGDGLSTSRNDHAIFSMDHGTTTLSTIGTRNETTRSKLGRVQRPRTFAGRRTPDAQMRGRAAWATFRNRVALRRDNPQK